MIWNLMCVGKIYRVCMRSLLNKLVINLVRLIIYVLIFLIFLKLY